MDDRIERDKGLRILSLDGGGPGCYSQLVILKEIMCGVSYDQGKDAEDLLPGDYFDFIGGTGFGAYIAMMLGLLRMNLDDAIDGLLTLTSSLFPLGDSEKIQALDKNLQTAKDAIEDILQSHDIPPDIKLNDERLRSCRSKVATIAVATNDMSRCQVFRTYRSRQGSINCTLVEALCASLAIPSLFEPVSIGKRLVQQKFVGGSIGFYNPTRVLLQEAKSTYEEEQRLALVLSLGSGLPSVLSLDSSASLSMAIESLANYMAIDCERVARELSNQLVEVDLYLRLNVNHGLEDIRFDDWSRVGSIDTHTRTYLETTSVTQALAKATDKITKQVGSITLGQLNRSTRIKHTAKPVPSLSPYYVVRKDEWDLMVNHLVVDSEDKRKIFVITGMGGCGKTQMVSYFVEKRRHKYCHIFFVDGSTTATIRGDLESAIRSLDEHQQDTYEDALAFLSTQSSEEWLYIIDNADDPDIDLTPYLPSCSHGTIIITSRNRRTRHLATTYHLELGSMLQEEAIETLTHSAQKRTTLSDNELQQAKLLVDELGCLALAVVQAGIYISEMSSGMTGRGFTFEQYLDLFQRHSDRLLRQTEHVALDRYPKGVYATLELSYTRLSEPCRQLLHVCAFLRHANIVVSMFSSAARANFEDTWRLLARDEDHRNIQQRLMQLFCSDGQWDELGFNDMLQSLSSFSLVSISSIHDIVLLRFHPLVHSYARDKLIANEQVVYRQMAITCALTCHELPQIAYQYMLPHWIMFYEHSDEYPLHPNDLGELGGLIAIQKRHKVAEEIFRKLINQISGTNDPDIGAIITVSGWLTSMVHEQGRWNESEALEKKLLDMCQKEFGSDNIHTLKSSAWLASIYREQGRWDEAAKLQQELLTTFQRVYGPEHPDTIRISRLLAYTFNKQGKFNEAEGMEDEVLAVRRRILGPEHPDTISATSIVASRLFREKKFKEAKALQEDILTMRQRILGPDHLDTIAASSNVANILIELGELNKAEVLQKEVLAAYQRISGTEHPDTLTASAGLAVIFLRQGDLKEAIINRNNDYVMPKMIIRPEISGPSTDSSVLASEFHPQAKFKEAKTLLEGVLTTRRKILGSDHLDTLSAAAKLATTLAHLDKDNEAEALQREVLEGRRKILGSDHPDTIMISTELAVTLYNRGKLEEASILEREVLAVREKASGKGDRETCTALGNLGVTLYAQGKTEEALGLFLRALEIAETILGLHDPDSLVCLDRLSQCYRFMDMDKEAAEMEERRTRIENER
ncbi:hypothetical protein CPB86DRAFT_743500 [Serendipita vermifera]|nr:hypothetical protein CPB86DRAFT_743500 [Serendipita vermifera]